MIHGRSTSDEDDLPAFRDWMLFLGMILKIFDVDEFMINIWEGCRDNIYEFISDDALIRVIFEFAGEALSGNDSKLFPNYDRLEEFISKEIREKYGYDSEFPPMFSWVPEEDKVRVKQEIEQNPLPNIKKEIPHPSRGVNRNCIQKKC